MTAPEALLGHRHTSLRDMVRDELREQIIGGVLAPGARLVERQLAERLGVSRVPVREALRALEREGFAEERQRRGMVVRALDQDEIEELFDVREALEALICRRVIRHLDKRGLQQMQAVLDEARDAIAAGDEPGAVRANAAFHTVMLDLSRSALVSTLFEPVAGRMRWLLSQHTDPARMHEEHVAIFAALADRDVDRAAALCREHLASSRAALSQTLRGTT